MFSFPLARSADLMLQNIESSGELVVYDLLDNRALCLAPDVSRVWRSCDGKTSAEMIARQNGMTPESVRPPWRACVRRICCKAWPAGATC